MQRYKLYWYSMFFWHFYFKKIHILIAFIICCDMLIFSGGCNDSNRRLSNLFSASLFQLYIIFPFCHVLISRADNSLAIKV